MIRRSDGISLKEGFVVDGTPERFFNLMMRSMFAAVQVIRLSECSCWRWNIVRRLIRLRWPVVRTSFRLIRKAGGSTKNAYYVVQLIMSLLRWEETYGRCIINEPSVRWGYDSWTFMWKTILRSALIVEKALANPGSMADIVYVRVMWSLFQSTNTVKINGAVIFLMLYTVSYIAGKYYWLLFESGRYYSEMQEE